MSNTLTSGRYFEQRRSNIMKMGAYYTDTEHCKDIYKMFRFSKEEETCVLEPSIGDGSAVKAVTDVEHNSNIKILGVELNDGVADETKKDPFITAVTKADFISGFIMSHKSVSFCFGNPPYSDDLEIAGTHEVTLKNKDRLERKFLEKVSMYLKSNGILCWVIPHRVLIENGYSSFWLSRYETLKIYKFRPSEYKKWGQVVIVGKRRPMNVGITVEEREKFQEEIALEKLQELPTFFCEEEKIDIPPSSLQSIKLFRSKVFDVESANEYCASHPTEMLDGLFCPVNQVLKIEEANMDEVFYPPIPLKKSNKAMLISCGIGAGKAGEDGVNLHLQRGSVTTYEETEIDPDSRKEIVRTKSKVNLIIVQDDGTITELV